MLFWNLSTRCRLDPDILFVIKMTENLEGRINLDPLGGGEKIKGGLIFDHLLADKFKVIPFFVLNLWKASYI